MILQESRLCSLNEVMSPLLKSAAVDPQGCFDLCCLYWKIILAVSPPLDLILSKFMWQAGPVQGVGGLLQQCRQVLKGPHDS